MDSATRYPFPGISHRLVQNQNAVRVMSTDRLQALVYDVCTFVRTSLICGLVVDECWGPGDVHMGYCIRI